MGDGLRSAQSYLEFAVAFAGTLSALAAALDKVVSLVERESGAVRRALSALLHGLGWPLRRLSLPFLGGLALGLVALSVVLGLRLLPSQTPAASITGPADGSRTGLLVAVTGDSAHVSADRTIWLFVQPLRAPAFHPQPGPVPRRPSGEWQASAQLGDSAHEPERGEKFELIAVIATRDASAAIVRYLEKSERTGSYPGLPILPGGAEIAAEITVSFAGTA